MPTTTQPMMERRAFLRVAARGAVAALAGLAFSRVASPRPTGQAPAPTHDLATPNLCLGRVLVAYFSRAGENYFDGGPDVPRGWEYRGRRRPDRLASSPATSTASRRPIRIPIATTTRLPRNVDSQEADARPAIANPLDSIDQYDTILLGSPIWNVRAPMIMSTFTEGFHMRGKTVHPFTTDV